MNSCELLTKIANEARETLMAINVYGSEPNRQYNENHPNATQALGGIDDPQNAKGKGTGVYLGSQNGGSYIDINGRPDVLNSGRVGINSNIYTPEKPYNCLI